jgi:hypothetical protein
MHSPLAHDPHCSALDSETANHIPKNKMIASAAALNLSNADFICSPRELILVPFERFHAIDFIEKTKSPNLTRRAFLRTKPVRLRP